MTLSACSQKSKEILEITWSLYPDPSKIDITPGEEVLFKITPKQAINNTNIVIDFGDNTLIYHKLECQENADEFEPVSSKCKTIYRTHIYEEEGKYSPTVKYKQNHLIDDMYLIKNNSVNIQIVSDIKTIEELFEDAFKQVILKLEKGINIVKNRHQIKSEEKGHEPLFSLSVLRNANFEYEERSKEFKYIQELIRLLVLSGYKVIEKHPQALIRLAHESLVRSDKNSDELSDKPLPYLEYGLRTSYKGEKKPFLYSVALEGVDDKLIQETTQNEEGEIYENIQLRRGETSEAIDSYSEKSVSHKRRPLYYSRFFTADYLIVIDPIKKPSIAISEPIYYNPRIEEEMIEISAHVKFNIRILNQDGIIVWIDNIEGISKQRVLEHLKDSFHSTKKETTNKETIIQKYNKMTQESNKTHSGFFENIYNWIKWTIGI